MITSPAKDKEILNQVRYVIKGKLKTIEDCKKVVDLDTLIGLTELQLAYTIDFFYEYLEKERPYVELLERGVNMLSRYNSYKDKIGLTLEVVQASSRILRIKEFDYELYLKLISYLAFREVKGGK